MEEKRTWRISFSLSFFTSASDEQGKNSNDGIHPCSLYLSSAAIPPSASSRSPGSKLPESTVIDERIPSAFSISRDLAYCYAESFLIFSMNTSSISYRSSTDVRSSSWTVLRE
jgi:hypothetical protein